MSDFSLKWKRFEKQTKEEKIKSNYPKSNYPKCPKCRIQLPENAKICYNCGACLTCVI